MYIIKKHEQGGTIALKPLQKPREKHKASIVSNSKGVLLIGKKEIEKDICNNNVIYALDAKGVKDEPHDILSFIRPLLTEFADVFPDELPAGLPPKRGIEH